MASIFTYDHNPPRVSSPWSTPGTSTPKDAPGLSRHISIPNAHRSSASPANDVGVSRLEAEPQEGPVEYKLHLLLRKRRKFISSSTGTHISGSQHSKAYVLVGSATRLDPNTPARPAMAPSNQSRQARLQQLTTQLLWRLQQSSPFHSSSTANLVLPLLPEATPRLNIPVNTAKLLPGLEESQGALYEIGVSDDGTFVGLIEDELEESLTNLRAMAASLGCIIEVLRKVVVGDCEWADVPSEEQVAGEVVLQTHTEKLWVAEALVRPDLETSAVLLPKITSVLSLDASGATSSVPKTEAELSPSKTEQLRVSLTGATASGKSSLLGTLTASTLDNGRGKSRLSLLKHRHEIASGITSSVAQELIGYHFDETVDKTLRHATTQNGGHESAESMDSQKRMPKVTQVINYAFENITSWNDMHSYADRLVFLSDSPGLPRYSKSTIRTLTSWKPHWTIVCVAADADEDLTKTVMVGSSKTSSAAASMAEASVDLTLSHLDLCLRLALPLLIVITKMDLATKSGLRQTLAKLLSALKAKGRKPVMLRTTPGSGQQSQMHSEDFGDFDMESRHVSAVDEQDVQRVLASVKQDTDNTVPVLLTSAVTGTGIGKLHGLLSSLPLSEASAVQTQDPDANLSHADPGLSSHSTSPSDIFHVDEVFAIPPSKVYSSAAQYESNTGVVLCGRMASGSISVGEELILGPFMNSAGSGGETHSVLSTSISTSPANDTDRSMFPDNAAGVFVYVRIVSIRNLRLPVRSLIHDQVGTIGVEHLSGGSYGDLSLRRTRRGMVLLNSSKHVAGGHLEVPQLGANFVSGVNKSITEVGSHAFTASFSSADFAFSKSQPLILGGHAVVYINSVRAAVKVTAVALSESDTSDPSSPMDMFSFDGDDNDEVAASANNSEEPEQIKITFRFVSSVEWMQLGDQVLVVPNMTAAGPVAGPSGPPTTGLSGFVGRVLDRSAR